MVHEGNIKNRKRTFAVSTRLKIKIRNILHNRYSNKNKVPTLYIETGNLKINDTLF